MPIHEYRCDACGRKFSFLHGVSMHTRDPQCPRCQGRELSRLISRVARIRSEEDMLEALAAPSKIGDIEDPRALARGAKQMGSAMGEEAGENFDDMVDEMMEAEGKGGADQGGEED